MKTTLIAIILGLCGTFALAGNYVLTINGKPYEIDLDEPTSITIEGNQKLQLKLEKKEVVLFKTAAFSFSHPSSANPARSEIGDGTHQTLMASPTGTLVMIQEYSNMDPTGLVDLMVSELTKEEVEYGYEITKTPATKKLIDGQMVSGKHVISTYRTDTYERYVVCYGVKDAGLLIITQADKTAPEEDLAMINLFWNSMKISMQ